MEENKTKTEDEFAKADKKFDRILEQDRSNIQVKKKIFMKISDVDVRDAAWFKEFCDKHADGKQFLGIKVIRQVMEKIDPLIEHIVKHLNMQDDRIATIETMVASLIPQTEEKEKIKIPKTQGSKKRENQNDHAR